MDRKRGGEKEIGCPPCSSGPRQAHEVRQNDPTPIAGVDVDNRLRECHRCVRLPNRFLYVSRRIVYAPSVPRVACGVVEAGQKAPPEDVQGGVQDRLERIIAVANKNRVQARPRRRPEIALGNHGSAGQHHDLADVMKKLPSCGTECGVARQTFVQRGGKQPLFDGVLRDERPSHRGS